MERPVGCDRHHERSAAPVDQLKADRVSLEIQLPIPDSAPRSRKRPRSSRTTKRPGNTLVMCDGVIERHHRRPPPYNALRFAISAPTTSAVRALWVTLQFSGYCGEIVMSFGWLKKITAFTPRPYVCVR